MAAPPDSEYRFCPRCAGPLSDSKEGGRTRRACSAPGCGFVFYGNPLPVVAALVEHEGKVLLFRGRGWPEKWFGLVTGFLEAGEAPEEAVLRELFEETGLFGEVASLIGAFSFPERNELIVAYHVRAQGEVRLGEELEAVKAIEPEKLRPWPFGTGLAVAAWLERRHR